MRKLITDGFVNILTGLGIMGQDARQSATVGGPTELSYSELDNLYSADDIVARLCDLPAQTMTRKWLQITGADDPVAAAEVLDAGAKLKIKKAFRKAITWGRLHGSALIIMIIDDGRPMDQPVNEEGIREIEDLLILDRWDVQIRSRVTKFGKGFGDVETYEILSSAQHYSGTGQTLEIPNPIVHASRVLRFDGVLTPKRRMDELQGWNDSAVTRVYEVIRDFQSSYGGSAAAMQNIGAMIYKIKGLAKMLTADKDDLVLRRLSLLNQSRSSFNMLPLDSDGEDVSPIGNSFTSAKDILQRWDQRLAAAIGWPVTVLMGRSPAGMNATGENDLAIFYDTMQGEQEDLTDHARIFYRYLMKSTNGPTGGKELKGWSPKWHGLWQESQGEQAKTRLTIAQADAMNIDRGVYTSEEAANSHYAGDEFSIDIQLDQEARATDEIEAADDIPGTDLRPEQKEPEDDGEGGDGNSDS
jgi:phage-related protein (TIGR01555 family)